LIGELLMHVDDPMVRAAVIIAPGLIEELRAAAEEVKLKAKS
jgi:hypothetical protein